MGGNRISPPSFKRVYQEGRSLSNRYLVLYHLPGDDLRMGVSTPKRLGNAVVRNRLRRLVKESFRRMLPVLSHGGQYVFIVRRPALFGTYWDIEAAMEQLLRRMGLY